MIFVTEYELRPHMAKADVKSLMDIFGKRRAATGEIAHFVRATDRAATTSRRLTT